MSKARTSLGTDWTLPGKKRRFATTPIATSNLIVMISEDGHTVDEAILAINFDEEAKDILRHFSAHGYGATLLAELVA